MSALNTAGAVVEELTMIVNFALGLVSTLLSLGAELIYGHRSH